MHEKYPIRAYIITQRDRGQAEAKVSRPRPRPRPKFWPQGHFGLEDITSLLSTNRCLQVRSLRVVYEHDGSDTQLDNFTVAVRRRQQTPNYFRSVPRDVVVGVRSINDQPPRLAMTTPLRAWSDDVTPLNRKSLTADDADTGPEALLFIVTHGPTNGHLAKVDRHSKPIGYFTQLDVDRGLVVFVHGGD